MAHVGFSWHSALTKWEFSAFPIAVLAVLVALAVWYLRADWRLAARGRRWSGARTAAFMSGLVAVDLALQSPVAAMTGSYFQAHVLQHLLLMVVGPPLLALGAPSTLLLQTSSRETKRRWLGLLRSGPFAVVSHPVVVWFLYYGVMFAFFLTSLLNTAMLHMWLMDLINIGFLFGATLFWWPMVGIDPIIHWKMGYPARMLNILLGSGVEAFLGVAILNSDKPLASMYTLSSTKAGGGLLWAATEVVTLGAFVPIFLQWMRSEQRIAARSDQRGGISMSIVSSFGGTDAGSRSSSSAGAASTDRSLASAASGASNGSGGSSGPAGRPAANASNGPNRANGYPPISGGRDVPVDTSRLTAWEYAWLSRTGSVPSRFVVPDHAPGPEEAGEPAT